MAQFDMTSFLENGALLQLSPNQFKVITGPFLPVVMDEDRITSEVGFIYKPYFWDFLNSNSVEDQVLKGLSGAVFERIELLDLLRSTLRPQAKYAWQNLDVEPFKEQFNWSQRQFNEHRLSKTVPIISQTCQTHFGPQNLAWVLEHLLETEHFGWAYGFWQKGEGFLGQTPELIAHWSASQKTLTTAALAGTLKNEDGSEQKILADKKIRQEHQFVVDDIGQNLKTVLVEKNILQKPTQILKLKHLVHLKTDFACVEVDFEHAWRAIKRLHPTAALGVYPRALPEMKIFSRMNLQTLRASFAAPFALIDKNQILCVAAIRNFCFTADKLTIFSGCGVTKESIYESELTELQIKRDSVKQMMGLTA